METKAQMIVAFMKANLDSELTLEKIAKAVSLSRSRVCDLVKAETGMPPGLYIKKLRLQMACKLLETTPLEVKQIMLEVGITDPSHFARDFKNRYSLTPSEYRAQRVAEQTDEDNPDETK